MKKRKDKKVWLEILALTLILGMTLAGCGGDGGGDGDPVTVDTSLPAIQSVANFTGAFASTEADQKDLVKEAFEVIADLGLLRIYDPGGSMENRKLVSPNRSRAVQRAVETWGPDGEILNKVMPGAVVTGFYRESGKYYEAKEYESTVGDYDEYSFRIKLSVDFDGFERNSATINGKYVFDGTSYEKYQIIALNPDKEKFTENLDINNSYALSISKGGKGIKFVMKETVKININNLEYIYGQTDPNYDDYTTYKLILDVYNNDGTKSLSKTFDSAEDASEYLGVWLGDYHF
jgi:hypothetical protein